MKKKAFTLVELIVVITILAILGTIAFISLSDYSKEARDSKRITDTSNLLSKINVENVRGINMSELINPLEKKTNILTINSKKENGLQGYPNFNALKEPEENFLDPKSKHRYPFAYAIGGEGKESYNFMQMATVSEKDGRARLVGNYYKFNDDTDSPSLFVQDGKDGEDIDNDYIVDNGEIPPYDIGVPVAPLPRDGVCGESDSKNLTSVPNSNLCSKGTAVGPEEIIETTGKYTWICEGANGGVNAKCSANKVENKCSGILPENAELNGTEILGKEWTYNETEGECHFVCNNSSYWDGSECIKHWTGDEADGFTYKDSSGNIVYPKNCNELLTNPIFQIGTTAPYNGTKFIDGFYNIKLKEDQNPTKSYCDMSTDGAGRTRIYMNTSIKYEEPRYRTCDNIGYYYSDVLECINPNNNGFEKIRFTREGYKDFYLNDPKKLVFGRSVNSVGYPAIGREYIISKYSSYTMRDYTYHGNSYNMGRRAGEHGSFQNDIIVYGR